MKIQFMDCEMLCWPDGTVPHGQTNHIIQIGAVEVDSETLKITRSKSYFIRPQSKHFEVSKYCTDLTGITRSRIIDEGHYFPEVMRTIKKEFAPQTKVTYAWGSDYEPIAEHCTKYSCSNPWAMNGIWDFGIIWRSAYNHKHKMPLADALESVGLKFKGRAHDAENDARALADLHNEMLITIRTRAGNKITKK
jgi:inhibitor of KinA sporulation pathway (predicted exonuclease)